MTTFRAAILLLLGALCFSTTGMFQSIAPEDASPWIVGEARMSVGCLCLFAWCFFSHKLPKNWKALPWKYIAVCTGCILAYSPLFFFFCKGGRGFNYSRCRHWRYTFMDGDY